MNYFDDQKPAFVTIKNEHFIIYGKQHYFISVIINKIQPVRKLFRNGKLICYSMDAKQSHHTNTYCCFCQDRFQCQRKIRLSLIWIDSPDHIPIILDINQASFPSLQHIIEEIGEDQLKGTPVHLKIIYGDDDRKSIEFST